MSVLICFKKLVLLAFNLKPTKNYFLLQAEFAAVSLSIYV